MYGCKLAPDVLGEMKIAAELLNDLLFLVCSSSKFKMYLLEPRASPPGLVGFAIPDNKRNYGQRILLVLGRVNGSTLPLTLRFYMNGGRCGCTVEVLTGDLITRRRGTTDLVC